jgi:hypothetical protein
VCRAILVALAVAGCARTGVLPSPITFTDHNYTLGQEVHANVGAPFVSSKTTTQGYVNRVETKLVEQRELVYSGRDGNTLFVTYREYTAQNIVGFDDGGLMARPAFSQDLRYDLAASDTIVFRDYRIRVVEATNEVIRVVVLSDRRPVSTEP